MGGLDFQNIEKQKDPHAYRFLDLNPYKIFPYTFTQQTKNI